MSKLTDTTKRTRMYVLYFIVFIIVVLTGQVIYRYATSEEDPFSGGTTPYSSINQGFGVLTYPEISSLAIADGSTPSFVVLGQFDDSPTSVNVYSVDKPRETLGSSVKAKDLAKSLEFNSSLINQDQNFKWSEGGRELIFNKLTENSTYLNSSLKNSSFSKPEFVDTASVDSLTQSLISTLKFPYSTQESEKEYLIKSGNSYSTTSSANNADFIKKTYFESFEIVSLKSNTANAQTTTTTAQNAESMNGRIYFNNFSKGSFSIILANEEEQTGAQRQDNIDYLVEFENNSVAINEETKSTYKLKSIEKAWEDVKDGKASLKSLVEVGGNPYASYQPQKVLRFTADPDQSELGFFVPDDWTGYIYPIYIFKGTAELDGGKTATFAFYVKAIED